MDGNKYYTEHVMISNDAIKNYISNNTELKIKDVLVVDKLVDPILRNDFFLEDMLNEIFAINADKDNPDPIANAAMAINNLKANKNSKIHLFIAQGHEELFKHGVQNYFSSNYSENVSIINYINILNSDPSISDIRFGSHKKSFDIKHLIQKLGLGLEHNYSITREENSATTINMYLENTDYSRGSIEITKGLSIILDDDYVKKLEPSKEIIKKLGLIKNKWPYPRQGESKDYHTKDKRLGAAIARYLPQLDWFDVYLRNDDFNNEMWTLFLSVLGKDPFINDCLKRFEKFDKNNLRRITKTFEVPVGELLLKIGTDIYREPEWRDPDILFIYNYRYSKETSNTAYLRFERAKFHEDNTDENGININPYAF